eukprot:EG_transcript_12502
MASANNTLPAAHKRGRKAKADAGLNVCLDYLKGKCTREQCRFVHPDLTAYQQLSEAVEAQAGREMCEVWAMTGQCKFGAKCNKLHPVMVTNPAGPGQIIALPAAAAPATDAGTAAAEAPAAAEDSEGAGEEDVPGNPPFAGPAVVSAAPDLTAEFEKFAESMRKILPEEEEEFCWQPSGKDAKELAEDAAPAYSVARRFVQSVLGLDSVLLDIFRDLNLVSC